MSRVRILMLAILMTLALEPHLSAAQQPTYDPFSPRRTDSGQELRTGSGRMASGEFIDTPVTDVFRVVSDLTGWSIIMSPGVSTQPPKVNLWVKNMDAAQVLEQVVNRSGLVLHREAPTVYHIMTFDEYARQFAVERRVRPLKHVSPIEVVDVLQPFIADQPAAKVIPAESGNSVVLLVPEPLIDELERLVDAIDVPTFREEVSIVRLEHLDVETLAPMLEQFLTQPLSGRTSTRSVMPERAAAQPLDAVENPTEVTEGVDENGSGEGLMVQLMMEPKLNAIIIRGLPADVDRAVNLLENLDQSPGLRIVSYQLQYTDVANLRETLTELVGQRGEGLTRDGRQRGRLRVAISEQNNRIVVEGSDDDQRRLAAIVKAIDQPLPAGAGDIRVYRLENSGAEEVAGALRSMLEETDDEAAPAGMSQDSGSSYGTEPLQPGVGGSDGLTPASQQGPGSASVPYASVNTLPLRVTPAPEINAVIVRASAAEHEVISKVVNELDRPRDQVLIEVTLVAVSATEMFNLGVEVGGMINIDGTDIIGFSTFGIGAVDPVTGALRIADPSPFGANIGIFKDEDFSLVLNALKTVGDIHISSVPKILVEDNSPAQISQLNEEPFEVTSQGESSTVTSFGGFVEAGTILSVTPHVASEDWLRMEYEINLSSFGTRNAEQLAANLPPPRAVNNSRGIVRVPAGHIVVLGGLTTGRDSDTVESVPFIGDIPLLGELFKNNSQTSRRDTLFIFIRPVVLRDRRFRDLILLSQRDLAEVKIEDNGYPTNPMKTFGIPLDVEDKEVSP